MDLLCVEQVHGVRPVCAFLAGGGGSPSCLQQGWPAR